MRKPFVTILLVSSLGLSVTAHASQNATPLEVRLTVNAIALDHNGHEQLVAVERAHPGDVLVYRAEYRNNSASAVHDVVGSLPMPEGQVEYLANAGGPDLSWASLDGKTMESVPVRRTELNQDGVSREHAVSPTRYRKVAWKIGDLAAGQSVVTLTRVRLVASNVQE